VELLESFVWRKIVSYLNAIIRLGLKAAQGMAYLNAKKNLKLLLDDEQVIRQDEVKWQENKVMPVDGILQLTNCRLRFLSIGADYISYFLTDVASITFRNYLAVIPMGILIEFSDGRKELFGLTKREQWVGAILEAKAKVGPVVAIERTVEGIVLDAESVAIRQRLSRHFSQDELKTLCFDLDVDYDNLAGTTKDEKARELVVRLDREGNLFALLKRGAELRPHVVWY
jgi:hypothetical protein